MHAVDIQDFLPTTYYHQSFTLYKKDTLKIIAVICITTPIQGRHHLGDRDVDGRIVPTFILKKVCDGADWIVLTQDGSCELLWHR
jgi:hypothetical protein